MIGMSLTRARTSETVAICLGDTASGDCRAICYDTESDMLTTFAGIVREWDPDVVCGWNTNGFGAEWCACRCELISVFRSYDDEATLCAD